MGAFKLATIDLEQYNFIPGRHINSTLPIKGHLDLPSRLGKTFHDWGQQHGIQPYVSASEIMLGGRDVILIGYILADTELECRLKALELSNLIDGFTDLVPFESPFGTFSVYLRSAIVADYITDQGLRVTIVMRNPRPDLSGAAFVPANNGMGIDGVTFEQMGGFLSSISGDLRNRPAAKSAQFTSYSKEGYQVTKRAAREMMLKIFLNQPDYESFEAVIRSLYVLFTAPGLRTLNLGTSSLTFFVKDGFQLTTVFEQDGFSGVIELPIVEASNVEVNPLPPLVNAGGNRIIILPTDQLVVSGASAIARGNAIITSVLWEFVSSSNGVTPMINNPGTLTPTLSGMSEVGIYTYKLTAIDNGALSANTSIIITVVDLPKNNSFSYTFPFILS